MKNRSMLVTLVLIAVVCLAPAASATIIADLSGADPTTGRAGEAIFDYTGTTLTITLINQTIVPSSTKTDITYCITGLFWNSAYVSSDSDRTNATAVVATGYPNASGSLLITGTTITGSAGTDVSSGWAYDQFSYKDANQGVAAAGYSGTGTQPNFDSQSLGSSGNGTAVDGGDYAILPANYVAGISDTNADVTKDPKEWNAVVFTFTGVGSKPDIADVFFQFGTGLDKANLDPPNVPLPPSALLLGTGLVGLGLLRWRMKKR